MTIIRTSPRGGAYSPFGAGFGDRATFAPVDLLIATDWVLLLMGGLPLAILLGAINSVLRFSIPEKAAPPKPPPTINPPNINNCRRLSAITN